MMNLKNKTQEVKQMELTLDVLTNVVKEDAAIRRIQRLQPVGGPGDKVFPPTYPGEVKSAPARHVFETRRIHGQDVRCVLIDSVQSQANRLEESLLTLIRANKINLPHIVVDFTGQKTPQGGDLNDLGSISSFEAPHRVFDAIIRDSELDGTKFTDTEHYKNLIRAKPSNALQVYMLSPASLVFGVWNSTGEGGGLGAKFTRCVVSEIVGVGAAEGQKGAVRVDPLGIRAAVKVVGGPLDWKIAKGERGEKSVKPSEINHSNIISNLVPGGVTIDHALHTAVISCAGLRRLRFPGKEELAGQTVLAAIALVALTAQDKYGYALRSRCDLVCDGQKPFEIVHPDGSTENLTISADNAIKVFHDSVKVAKEGKGFRWNETPLRLKPQRRLVELVALSRAKALVGETENDTENA